jgi:hypothetical protein
MEFHDPLVITASALVATIPGSIRSGRHLVA